MKFKKVQIEISSKCNLNCRYCLRNSKGEFIDPKLIENLDFKEYVLYGYGEPFLHPRLKEIVSKINGKITISTNGMVNDTFKDVIELIDRVGISVDLNDDMRRGFRFEKALEKMKYLDGKGVMQVVVTRDNIGNVKKLAEVAASNGLSFLATNAIASNEEIYNKTVYFEGSKRNVELTKELDEKFLINAIAELSKGKAEKYKKLIDEVYNAGYSINLISIIESKERIELAYKAESIFEEVKDVTESYGVELMKPEFFGDAKSRECPYKDSMFVRADGFVSSCMPFAYSHQEFVNNHAKSIKSYIPTHVNELNLDTLYKFEKIREDMENFPWCADCPYVRGCWYAESNIDCYINEPSCSECLYSCRIARCLLE